MKNKKNKTNKETTKKTTNSDLLYLENDKILKKVEKYVDKNREKILERIDDKNF